MTGIKGNGIKHCYRAKSQGPIYQIWMGSHLQKSKDGRKVPKMQMAAFFGKSLLSQLLHNLESHVWGQNWGIQGQGIHLCRFQIDTYPKMFFFWRCMSAILDFYDLDQF